MDTDYSSPFLADGKSQVTIRRDLDGNSTGIDTIVTSVLHPKTVSLEELRHEMQARVLEPLLEKYADLIVPHSDIKYFINPSGAWHIGGPTADTGLTGRKTVIDSYGSDCPIGGGSFSGKDPTKVDRS